MCFDQRNRLRRFFFFNGILALRVEISKKHTILFKKLFQIIVVYIYVLNLEGLNTLFGFKACTYRISLVSFVSLFNSNSWHGVFFNYWFVLRLFFIFFLIQNCAFCILFQCSIFNACFFFKLKTRMKMYVLNWKQTTVTVYLIVSKLCLRTRVIHPLLLETGAKSIIAHTKICRGSFMQLITFFFLV